MTRELVTHLVVEAFVRNACQNRLRCLTQTPLQLFLSTHVTKHGRAFDAGIARFNVSCVILKAPRRAFIYL
jgi:hypothetical protein